MSEEKVSEAKKSLIAQFQASTPLSKEEEQAKLEFAFAELEKTPTGRQTLELMEKLDYKIVFEPALQAKGVCHWNDGIIGLNPAVDPQFFPSLLVHETQHALQAEIYPKGTDFEAMQVKDLFKFRRAIEGDACAHQSAYCYEMSLLGQEVQMPEGYEAVYDAYAKAIQNGDKKEAMNVAFKKWYDSEEKTTLYDCYYAEGIKESTQEYGEAGKGGLFEGKLSDKEMSQICLFEGKPYVEPEFFSSEKASCLSAENKTIIAQAMKEYAKVTGGKVDTSVLSMPTKKKNQPVISHKKETPKKEVSTAFFVKQQAGR